MFNKNCVDIILPVYNSEKFIHKTLKSVYNQTYNNWKLIIIDDLSIDNSLDILNGLIKKKNIKKKFYF